MVSRIETIISSNDEGEKPNNGGILISKVGEGYFVYTSYHGLDSFLQELVVLIKYFQILFH